MHLIIHFTENLDLFNAQPLTLWFFKDEISSRCFVANEVIKSIFTSKSM